MTNYAEGKSGRVVRGGALKMGGVEVRWKVLPLLQWKVEST